MAGLEGIVRPFQRPDTLARRRLIASASQVEVTPAIISWGSSGTLASAHQIDEIPDLENGGSFTVLTCDDQYEETQRQVDVRRVVQTLPDGTVNPDNFVDLERPYRVYFEKKELASQQRGITQTWTTAFDAAQFQTTNNNNKKCQSAFTLRRDL